MAKRRFKIHSDAVEEVLVGRRDFLKGGALLGATTAAAGMFGGKPLVKVAALTGLTDVKRVDKVTTEITGTIKRPDEREMGFARAGRGDFGEDIKAKRSTFVGKYPINRALSTSARWLIDKVDGPVNTQVTAVHDPAKASQHIKAMARFCRADMVGICETPKFAVYTNKADGTPFECDHKYAIGVLIDQDNYTFQGSTGFDMISAGQSMRSYSHSGFIACQIAEYIRNLGYPARAHYSANYGMTVPPVFLFGGLGEMNRSQVVITPTIGTRFKGAVITTDMPLEPDKPIDFGAQSFCEQCLVCADECPSASIPKGGKEVYNGYKTWLLDVPSCTKFRIGNDQGSSCGRCIKVCPWNRPDSWYHEIAVKESRHSTSLQKLLIEVHKLMDYNLDVKPECKWWDVNDF